jgi:23S rRNA pseudouridine2605 synthase
MNKPAGVITSVKDTHHRKTVIDILPAKLKHLRPVGRLDMHSTGLLLLTNDGDLANKLIHPSSHIPKTYLVRIKGKLTAKDIKQIETGIMLDDGITLPCQLRNASSNKLYTKFILTIYEGRNRQIRRMLSALGYRVIELTRLSLGKLQLGQLESGVWRYLTDSEIESLKKR